jgi:kynurenine formamidase
MKTSLATVVHHQALLSAAISQCEQLGNCSHQPCTQLALDTTIPLQLGTAAMRVLAATY